MNDSKPTALDWESLGLSGAEADLARIIAEETEAERSTRRIVASVAQGFVGGLKGTPTPVPEETAAQWQPEHTLAEIDAMSWDELLVLDGECFIRCWQRTELPPAAILSFVEVQCTPANPLAVRWFSLYMRLLTEKDTNASTLIADIRARLAKTAADAKHDQPGGSRWKRQRIREIWASGKYSSRDICAEQEAAALEMSFATARKALRGTPDPT